MKQKHAVKMLSAIAHDGRLSLIRRLIQAGPEGMSAGDIARFAKIGATTASAQLLILANAGLITSERRGRQVVYSARYDCVRDLLQFLMLDCCAKRPDICVPVAEAVSA